MLNSDRWHGLPPRTNSGIRTIGTGTASTVSKGITTTGTFTNAATSNVKGFDVEARYSFDPGIPRGSEPSH